ncbi:MAG: helix-turn-helix transcriptional regulator [Chloroflexi bacterium]|nr:helix-turn-helix transcriptional regulator [Chloroflexota bacterium]
MVVRTRIFELYKGKYKNLCMLAQAMGISASQIYRVRQGERNINQKFIIGAMQAFPGSKFDDLFYLSPPTMANKSHHAPK